jgi:hypothetical protein
MSSGQRACDDCNRDLPELAGVAVCSGDGLPDAAAEATDGGICVAENVSGLRVDYAAGEPGLPGVREGAGERSGAAGRARVS